MGLSHLSRGGRIWENEANKCDELKYHVTDNFIQTSDNLYSKG